MHESEYTRDERLGRYFRRGERPFPLANVHAYVDLEGASLDEWETARLLQVLANQLLGTYLNGWALDRRSTYLFPWATRTSGGDYRRTIQTLTTLLARAARMSGTAWKAPDDPAEMLASSYRALDVLIDRTGAAGTGATVSAGGRYDEAEYAAHGEYLAPVRSLARRSAVLRPDAVAFFLHGSMATLDFAPGFSDLDTLLVLRRETVTDAARLRSLQRRTYPLHRYMFQMDPLQHHGFFYVTEVDLRWYPESFFPLTLFRFAKTVWGRQELAVAVRPSPEEYHAALWGIVQWLRERHLGGLGLQDAYLLKLHLSFLLLLPALLLQARGQPCYKRESFALLPAVFDGDAAAIERASQLRTQAFPVPGYPSLVNRLPTPPAIIRRIGLRHLQVALRGRISAEERAALIVEGFRTGEQMLERLP